MNKITRRDIDGIVLLDKPEGLSSNQALQRVRYLYRARKAGHAGSLDPFATGMLPVCFGQSTKVCAFLLDSAKHYRTTCALGKATDSADLTGEVVATRDIPTLDQATIESTLQTFMGEIEQVPPMYSALKHQGRRLYELAREGKEVERAARRITIHDISLDGFSADSIELTVHCSKGTYIRTLLADVAEALGTVGHASMLRRLSVEPFDGLPMVGIEQLEQMSEAEREALLLPTDRALTAMPRVSLDQAATQALRHGQPVHWPCEQTGLVRVYSPDDEFVGVAELRSDNRLKVRRLMAT